MSSCLPGLAFLYFYQLHRFAVAEDFTTTGFLNKNNVSADITAVDLTSFLNIYHVLSLNCPFIGPLCS